MRLHAPSSVGPLRRRNFALIWSGGLVSVIGTWMQTVAVGALVTARTGEATWTVLVAAGAFLPLGLLSPVGGALADRFPRRPALVLGNCAQACLASVLTVLVISGRPSPLTLTSIVTLEGCISAFTGPFQQAILPDLVPRAEFLAASSLGSAQYNLGRVIGPALAGVAIAAFGYSFAFAANAVSFLAVVIALAFVRLSPPPGARGTIGITESIRLGAREARAEPACRAAIGTIALVGFFGSPFIALVPYVARSLQHGGSVALASATGQLTTAQGVGAVTGALLITPLANIFSRGRVLMYTLALLPLALVLYSVAPNLALATGAIFLVGFVYIGVLSGLSTVVQLRAPARYRGRILSFYLVALGVSYPIGSLTQGPLADRVGFRWTCGGAAVLLVAALAIAATLRPSARRALFDEAVHASGPDAAISAEAVSHAEQSGMPADGSLTNSSGAGRPCTSQPTSGTGPIVASDAL